MRLRFLFPSLSQKAISDLLWCQAEFFVAEIALLKESSQQTVRHAQFAEHQEAHAREAKRKIEAGMRSLTPIQQEIVRVKIFRNLFAGEL